MTKINLSFEEDYDFFLIGVCTHAKDYRVCWFMNNILEINLEKKDNLELRQKGKVASFSMYSFYKDDDYLEYHLISNRGDMGYLISEEKPINFFFQIKGPIRENEKKELLERVNSIPIVLKAYEVNVNNLKSKKNLIF